jgi:hypothetical protein
MSTVETNHAVKTGKKPKAPPDEQFWKKYSPHYELPISSLSSLLAHGLLVAVLIIGGVLAAKLGLDGGKPPDTEAIVIAGGGGHKEGVGNAPGTGVLPSGKDVVTPQEPPPPVVGPAPPRQDLKPPEVKPQPLVTNRDDASDRAVADNEKARGAAAQAVASARQQLEGLLAGKGQGGPGSGGGLGKGTGTGQGDLEGPGRGKIGARNKRQQRWTMIFNTRDGQDYIRQLQSLRAIVAIPGPDNTYMVYEDLAKPPVQKTMDDLSKIDRIYWIDDNPQSVDSFARALKLPSKPELIAAFFPYEFEQELADKERKHLRRGSVDDILWTKFQVVRAGGRYDVQVVDQKMR